MASTIIIKNGAGGSTPSSLKQGELAINVDSGSLYYGTSGSSNTVSSSFYIANLTASGAISASGNITTPSLFTDVGTGTGIFFKGHGKPILNQDAFSKKLNLGAHHSSVDHSGIDLKTTGSDNTKGLFLDGVGNVTASGNISASGDVIGQGIFANSNYRLEDSGGTSRHIITEYANVLSIGNTNFNSISITGSILTNSTVTIGDRLNVTRDVDAQAHISSSGDITASGNIYGTYISASAGMEITSNGTTPSFTIHSIGEAIESDFMLIKQSILGGASSQHFRIDPQGKTLITDATITSLRSTNVLADMTINNNINITGKEAGGTARNMVGITTADVVAFGNTTTSTRIQGGALSLSGSTGIDFLHPVTMSGNGGDSVALTTLGGISSSAKIYGTSIEISTNGALFTTIDASGNIAAEGAISSSGALEARNLILKNSGVHKASIDASGNVAVEGYVSASGALEANSFSITNDGDNRFSITNAGSVSASRGYVGSSLSIANLGAHKASIDNTGALWAEASISSSGALSGTSLELATAGVPKATITADGTASFDGGIDIGYTSTASLGYISASQLIIQGTDETAAIVLKDNDGNNIGQFSRVGSGANAHVGQMILRDNADIKVHFKANNTCFVSNDFSSSAALMGNTAQFANNGINTLNISNAGAISASSTIQGTAFTAQVNGATKATIDEDGNIAAEGAISSSGVVSGTALTLTTAGVHKASIDASGNVAAEGAISSSGALSGTSLSLTANGASVRTGLIAHYNLIGYGTGDGSNFEFAKNMATNTAPFNHDVSYGSDGLTAQTIQIMIRMGGIVMPRAGTLTKWTGWSTCAGNGTSNIALFKMTPTRNDNTNLSAVLLHDYSYTALGNAKMEDFDLTSFTENSLAAGDMVISGMKSVSGQIQFFTSTFEVEFD